MQELTMDEIDAVAGGFPLIPVIAIVCIIGAVGVGVYVGYKDAEAAAGKK